MNARGPSPAELRVALARLAASPAPMHERAAQILQLLGRSLAFDAGWVAVRDPDRRRHVALATTGNRQPCGIISPFRRPTTKSIRLGLNRRRPPMRASTIPGSLSETRAWGDHLLPAGFREGVAAGLFAPDGRHIGFISLLSADRSRPSPADCRVVAGVTALIAAGLDRTWDIAETARIIEDATAGVVLTRGGDVLPLPGLPDDRLLIPGSRILAVAAQELAGSAFTSFLAPPPGPGDDELVRVTALDFARPDLDHLTAAVLLSPPADLSGLAVLDLRVLGLLIDGVSELAGLAEALPAARRVVADSVEHILAAFGANDLMTAAMRSLRTGLRIPPGAV